MICPWYSEWSFANAPSLILVAACGLRWGRRFAYFIAVVASGVVVVRGVFLNINLSLHHEILESWGMMARLDLNPFLSLHAQHLFALLILMTAAYMSTVTSRHSGIQQALGADSPVSGLYS